MALAPVFMIRGGAFGTDFEAKLVMVAAAFAGVLYDWRRRGRLDYAWTFLFGTATWTLAELVLQTSGVREIHQATLFGAPLPFAASVTLQGASEGAVVAVLGLFCGDRMLEKGSRWRGALVLLLTTAAAATKALLGGPPDRDVGGDVPSRREVFAAGPVAFLSVVGALVVAWCWRTDSQTRRRVLAMFVSMVVFAGFWTLAEFVANARWIEVESAGGLVLAPPALQFGALAWDVVVEIALAYIPFFAVPRVLGLIKSQ
ncbi:MAG: hypothetical protein Kow0069_05860 [Promethearchaeota archaeon]